MNDRTTRRGARLLACCAGAALSALSPALAGAQATALERFEPAPAGDALLGVPSPAVPGDMRPSAGALLSYAHTPLILKTDASSDRQGLGTIVSYQATVHALAAVELFRLVKVDLDVPFTLGQGGESPSGTAAAFASPSGAAMNDLRAGVRVSVLRPSGALPGAAIAFDAWLPTGDDAAYTGTGATRFAPSVIVGADTPRLVWSATLGRRFQNAAGSLLGSEVVLGAGIASRFHDVQIGPELYGSTVADQGTNAFSRRSTNLELLLGVRYRLGPITLSGGAGPGLTAGAGTPDFRLVAGASLTPDLPKERALSEPAKAPAPKAAVVLAADRDGDGVSDATDLCPDVIGESEPSARRLGCPPDKDADGVVDSSDACPDEPGTASSDAAKNGCPADSDGDGIVDNKDACPAEKGAATDDPKTNGCPTSVRLEGTQIVILQEVHFETGRAQIQPDSFDLLGEVAQVMQDHPEIARLAVDGHTDSVGSQRANTALSQMRAVAVLRWLTEHGVDARRLESRGFGPRQPIADNKTDAGRAKNRRVEFQVRRKTPEGAAGWRDGPLD